MTSRPLTSDLASCPNEEQLGKPGTTELMHYLKPFPWFRNSGKFTLHAFNEDGSAGANCRERSQRP